MIGVGTDLDIDSFKNLIVNKKSSLVGLLIQITFLPIIGIVTRRFRKCWSRRLPSINASLGIEASRTHFSMCDRTYNVPRRDALARLLL